MGKFLKKYLWLWEFIGAALLVGLGLVIGLLNQVLLIFVGLIFIFLGLFRIITLVKTTDDKVLKWVYASELILDVLIGAALFYLGTLEEDKQVDLKNWFGYLIAAVFYLRGFVYLFATSVRKEDSKLIIFLVHVALLTLATVIASVGGFKLEVLGWVLFAVAIICAGFVTYDGIKKYNNYRNEEYAINKTKKVKVEEKKIDAPTSDEINTNNVNIDKAEEHDQLNA